MSVKKEANGRRSVQVEVEVPGTPEQVWQAIATGPGVGAWFVPTEVDGRIGGTFTSHFGGGMDAVATITEWDAPHRFVKEDSWGPNGPTMATEWIVEARGGGTCMVRVVHSLFAETDDWDDQLTGVESGWPSFFSILRLYLEHFAGQPETLRYLNYVADKFDLRRDIQFRSRVKAAVYHEDNRSWGITLEDGSSLSARFLITAIGPLSTPTLPRQQAPLDAT